MSNSFSAINVGKHKRQSGANSHGGRKSILYLVGASLKYRLGEKPDAAREGENECAAQGQQSTGNYPKVQRLSSSTPFPSKQLFPVTARILEQGHGTQPFADWRL